MEVPEVEQQAIREAYKDQGIEPTEADIIRAFNARKALEADSANASQTVDPGFDGLR
jgi:hypothetical protein